MPDGPNSGLSEVLRSDRCSPEGSNPRQRGVPLLRETSVSQDWVAAAQTRQIHSAHVPLTHVALMCAHMGMLEHSHLFLLSAARLSPYAAILGSSEYGYGYSHCSLHTAVNGALRRSPHVHSCTTSVTAARISICSGSSCSRQPQ